MVEVQFIFTKDDGKEGRVLLKTDCLPIDIKNESFDTRFTLMNFVGDTGDDSPFKKYFPWWTGSVISLSDFFAWIEEYGEYFDEIVGYSDEYSFIFKRRYGKMLIHPTVSGKKEESTLVVKSYNKIDELVSTIEYKVQNGVTLPIQGKYGYHYNFSLKDGDWWKGEQKPEDVYVYDEDVDVNLDIITAGSNVKIILIPHITGREVGEVNVKELYPTGGGGMATYDIENGKSLEIISHTGNKVYFSLPGFEDWTGGEHPSEFIIHEETQVELNITVKTVQLTLNCTAVEGTAKPFVIKATGQFSGMEDIVRFNFDTAPSSVTMSVRWPFVYLLEPETERVFITGGERSIGVTKPDEPISSDFQVNIL